MDGWSCGAGCPATGIILRASAADFGPGDCHVIWRVYCNGPDQHEWVPSIGTTVQIEPARGA